MKANVFLILLSLALVIWIQGGPLTYHNLAGYGLGFVLFSGFEAVLRARK